MRTSSLKELNYKVDGICIFRKTTSSQLFPVLCYYKGNLYEAFLVILYTVMSYSGLPSLINSWHHHHFDCSRVTLRVFFSKTKQLCMHGTLASLKKKQSAFLSSFSFELHAVLTLWNMNFLVTCHCFASATKVLFVESSIYDFGSMLSSVWKDGHFLSSCEKNIERCLKDKWQMASTSLDKNSSKPEKSHIPP